MNIILIEYVVLIVQYRWLGAKYRQCVSNGDTTVCTKPSKYDMNSIMADFIYYRFLMSVHDIDS